MCNSLQDVSSTFGIDTDEIMAAYLTGSRLYHTNHENSDFDYVVVTRSITCQLSNDKFDAMVFREQEFIEMIKKHNLVALECIWSGPEYTIFERKSYVNEFRIHLPSLRSYISENTSYSWVRAKKKLIVPEDFNPYRAKKTLWHAFRVLYYGIQIAKFHKLVDYQESNFLYHEIMSADTTIWSDYEHKYKKMWNQLKTQFRCLAALTD
eukprot:TRINITY_DN781_c0_g3_i1.p1 TRINITY_DN781_c0_g3~~TRINITY_DN781_c0_g3_i1.p1  ORF type:complete len:208 (+),score=2.85 TRINITY_DN781_c0_g3_i1:24-647(+)